MVARLNNTSAPFYRLYKKAVTPQPPSTINPPFSLENAVTKEEEYTTLLATSPILALAKRILQNRLDIQQQGEVFLLDGKPTTLLKIAQVANACVAQNGGRALAYPGLKPHDEAHNSVAMRIRHFANEEI